MDLSSVNALGVIAFSCFKFGGYFLAFVLLKGIQPAIQASAILMAGARTVLGVLILLRIFVWVASIHFFSREANLGRGREWQYALGGTLWSSLMDFPAALFAVAIPGAVLFC